MINIQLRAMLIEGYNLGKLYETTPIVKKWVSEYIYNEQISKEEMIHNLISDLVMQNDSLRNVIMEMHKSRAFIKVVDELPQRPTPSFSVSRRTENRKFLKESS